MLIDTANRLARLDEFLTRIHILLHLRSMATALSAPWTSNWAWLAPWPMLLLRLADSLFVLLLAHPVRNPKLRTHPPGLYCAADCCVGEQALVTTLQPQASVIP